MGYRYLRNKAGAKTYTIEVGRGATYASDLWTVYGHDFYPRGSVLAGSPRRTWVASYPSLDAAKAAYPKADVLTGTSYVDIDTLTAHLPDDGDY